MTDAPYVVEDPRFARATFGSAQVERLWTGGRWTEGPAYFPAGRYLVFSDIPNDRTLRFDETDGFVSVFRAPADNANGHTRDGQGRLVSCEHRTRRVTRTEHDGSITVVADAHLGRRLNSPNDVVVAADGAVWFTDPVYGIDSDYEGDAAPSEQATNNVYRVDPASGAVEAMATDFVQPNGLAFGPDGRRLYVVDTGRTHVPDGPAHIRAFDVGEGGRLTGGEVLCECDVGLFDGLRVDAKGRIWTSAGDGVQCFAPDGARLGRILLPEPASNVCFGGPKRNRLYVTATTSLYAVYVNARGLY